MDKFVDITLRSMKIARLLPTIDALANQLGPRACDICNCKNKKQTKNFIVKFCNTLSKKIDSMLLHENRCLSSNNDLTL